MTSLPPLPTSVNFCFAMQSALPTVPPGAPIRLPGIWRVGSSPMAAVTRTLDPWQQVDRKVGVVSQNLKPLNLNDYEKNLV